MQDFVAEREKLLKELADAKIQKERLWGDYDKLPDNERGGEKERTIIDDVNKEEDKIQEANRKLEELKKQREAEEEKQKKAYHGKEHEGRGREMDPESKRQLEERNKINQEFLGRKGYDKSYYGEDPTPGYTNADFWKRFRDQEHEGKEREMDPECKRQLEERNKINQEFLERKGYDKSYYGEEPTPGYTNADFWKRFGDTGAAPNERANQRGFQHTNTNGNTGNNADNKKKTLTEYLRERSGTQRQENGMQADNTQEKQQMRELGRER